MTEDDIQAAVERITDAMDKEADRSKMSLLDAHDFYESLALEVNGVLDSIKDDLMSAGDDPLA
jgi:hypothetical protein